MTKDRATLTREQVRTLRRRVAKGVALLNKRVPEWAERVIETNGAFNICSYAHCVLGATFQHYSEGIRKLKLSREDAIEFGFNLSENEDDPLSGTSKAMFDANFNHNMRVKARWAVLGEAWWPAAQKIVDRNKRKAA